MSYANLLLKILYHIVIEMNIRESCLQTWTFIYKPGISVTKQDFHLQTGILGLQMGFSGYYLPKTNLAIAYLICIVPIRMYTGGYHAKTYFKCNVVFGLLFLLNILMFQYIVENELEIQLCITTLLSFYIIERFAPVENENKKLTSRQKKKYKKISIVLFIIYYFISILFLSKQIEYGVIILLVLNTVSILILEVKINETNKIQSIKKNC